MKIPFLLTGLLSFAAPALGGELIQELVPADARWLAHVDLEGMQQSVLFQMAREVNGEKGLNAHLNEAREQFGFDPLAIGRSITFYSSSAEPEHGVAVLVLGEEAAGILEHLKQQPGYRALQAGGRELLSWSDPKGWGDPEGSDDPDGDDGGHESVYAYVRRFEGVSNQLVYISDQSELVLGAIDVLEGARPSLGDPREGGLAARPMPGSFVYFETSEALPGLDDVAQVSAVAALARGMRFELGETNGVMSAQLSVQAKDARDAGNISSVLQGVTALAALVGGQHGGEGLRLVVDALRFNTHGNEVAASFTFDSRRLLGIVHELEDRDE